MAIRKKTKYLVRFFLSKNSHYRTDIEYCGKDLKECTNKLRPSLRQYVTSFSIYKDGQKAMNVPIKLIKSLS